ncbi:ty1-copia retrotransposon protein [Cucumis melo var. makuwa]|uniref:Ty1-copia retrotransposon protein n=1 Tax=Cucumis melo var. makuwa TaxID=1194695 RepID=A0A5A7TSI8_CUCMM|nr:ty1-copia retrotransposon protein [Cucumis melo var. makuwa]
MTDDKSVMEQIHEYKNLVVNVLSEGMKMCEILQENVMLEKFPSSWNDYQTEPSKKKGIKGKNSEKRQFKTPGGQIKKKKLKPTPQANLAKQDSEIIAAIVKANLIENKTNWILDTGASRHFCTNRELLHDYEDTADEECVFMGNSATAGVIGKEKEPDIWDLLNRTGLKIVLEGDKVVLTKNGDFVGKGYLSNGLFVLNTISINANASSSAYMIESANLWHGRLGHVWGCLAKVPFLALKKSKVGSKTFDCIFIGYAQNSAAYRFMCLNDKTINESRDAEFFEHVFPLKQSLYAPSLSKRMHDPENPSIVSETPVSETVDTSNLRCELKLRRSKRQRTEKSFGPDFLSTFIVERRDEIDCNFTNLYLIDEDPKTYQEALNSVDSSMWKEAIKSELDSLVVNHTWDLMDLPMGNKPIRYLGEADVILGVKIRKNKTSLSLCQSHYVEKILKKFDSFHVSPVRTPFDASKHLKKNKGDSVSQPEYAKIIGSVMYLMNYTKSDIAYAVSRLSRYTHNPDRYHWDALRHLLRYLKGTIDYCLHFNKFPAVLEGYCDANWVTDNDEVNSTSGYVFLPGGGAISWKSAKQTCIARSTMEFEFIALELAG